MRSRLHRRKSPIADLDVTAFINLMVVLVAFFLSSIAYFQISVLELNIPPAANSSSTPNEALQLEITIRKNALEIGDRSGGLIRRIDNSSKGYDFKALNEVLKQIKARFPEKTDAAILAETDIPYEVLIKTMDATRTYAIIGPGSVSHAELFPDLSIGDAPGARISP